MRVPRIKFTIAWMMLGVGLLALFMCAWHSRMVSLRRRYQIAATHYSTWEVALRAREHAFLNEKDRADDEERRSAEVFSSAESDPWRDTGLRADFEKIASRRCAICRQIVRKYQQDINATIALRRNYERAAARPWLLWNPDPP